MSKMQPEYIKIIGQSKRKLGVDYDYNNCKLVLEIDNGYEDISLNESEVKRLHKALSRFLDFRKYLLETM